VFRLPHLFKKPSWHRHLETPDVRCFGRSSGVVVVVVVGCSWSGKMMMKRRRRSRRREKADGKEKEEAEVFAFGLTAKLSLKA
jgi:hypothetical protein